MQEENRGSKNSSINTLQEIALLNLSGSINTRNTETFFVSFLFYFCFMLYALIQHVFTYLSLSSYIALLIKNNSGYYTAYSHKTFSRYKSIFQFVYFFFPFSFQMARTFTKRWDGKWGARVHLLYNSNFHYGRKT